MTKMRILANNLHDRAAMSVTGSLLPVANTQKSEKSLVWRASADRPQTVTGANFAGFIDCIAIHQHTLSRVATIKVDLFNGGQRVYQTEHVPLATLIPLGEWRAGVDSFGATYNEAFPKEVDLYILWLPQPILIDQYQITLTNNDNTQQTFDVGRIFVGLSFSFEYNYSYGASVSWLENAEHKPTEGGTLRTINTSDVRRHFSISLNYLSEEDKARLVSELVKAGMGKDLLVSLYPGSGRQQELEHTMVCRRQISVKHTHNALFNWQSQLEFLEV